MGRNLSQPCDKICFKKQHYLINKNLVTVWDILHSHHIFQLGDTCLELGYLVMYTDFKMEVASPQFIFG